MFCRYGPGYLRHAQSWRYLELVDSFQDYRSASSRWRLCPDPSDHSCLEHYPVDGNLLFHPETFVEWRVEKKAGRGKKSSSSSSG